MSNLRMAAGAACCFVALFSGQAAASEDAQCWQPYEVEAARVYDLHVMLMLGSLKCRSVNSEITGKYDVFFEKKHDRLNNYNNILMTRFMRISGIADGQHAYEQFTTKLGNSHSNNAQQESFCQITDTLLTLATNAGDKELPLLAKNFSERPAGVGDTCEAPATLAAADAASASGTTLEQPAPAVAAPAATAKAADPPTPQAAAAALEAAAIALQTAAASLRTQPGPSAAPQADKPAATTESKAEAPAAPPAPAG